jgi:type IV pilus assembly protein PilY1
MVDAVTGTLLWSGGNNDDARTGRSHNTDVAMTHSIPASPGFADVDADGILDIIFVIDIAGGVWRFDLKKDTTAASNFADGGRIFNLEEASKFRRFYNRPDVVLNAPRADLSFITMIIGSGYRSDPRNEDQADQIYVLYEDPLFGQPEDTDLDGNHYNDGLILADALYNARAVDEIGDPVDPPNKETNANDGYFIPLNDLGEKVLQPSVTLNNVAVVTSYLPNGFDDGEVAPEEPVIDCGNTSLGAARVYFLDINTGQSKLTGEFLNLNFSGIPVEPTIVFAGNPSGGTTPVICVGTECFGEGDEPSDVLGEIDTAYRRYWRENVHGQGPGS